MKPRLALTLALGLLAPAPLGAAAADRAVDVTVTGLRSTKGQVLACLTARPKSFPDCGKDPQAIKRAVPAGSVVKVDFGMVPQGSYAIAVVHDENGNGRMDKRLMMPSEGFGFSRDAPVRLGPPSFASAAFKVGAAGQHQSIHIRYML